MMSQPIWKPATASLTEPWKGEHYCNPAVTQGNVALPAGIAGIGLG